MTVEDDIVRPASHDRCSARLVVEQLLADYPYLEREDVLATLEYAAAVVDQRELPLARSA